MGTELAAKLFRGSRFFSDDDSVLEAIAASCAGQALAATLVIPVVVAVGTKLYCPVSCDWLNSCERESDRARDRASYDHSDTLPKMYQGLSEAFANPRFVGK